MQYSIFVDGPISGPTSFCGPVGKNLTHCQYIPVFGCIKIYSIFPELHNKNLSPNQKYRPDICQVILTGKYPQELAIINLENVSISMQGGAQLQARARRGAYDKALAQGFSPVQLTVTNIILRLYSASIDSTQELKKKKN